MAKKKDEHHGGAWKVAYADFVTAMMALFMVLWISAQDKEILIATSQYFQNPFRSPIEASSGVMPFNTNRSSDSSGLGAGDKQADRGKLIQMTFLNSVAADFYRLIHLDENLEQKSIDIQVTTDGLRVTLFDRGKRPLFKPETTEFTEWGAFIMQNLAWMIERHAFSVTIDGHAGPVTTSKEKNYTSWELSADRANASRRTLVHYAVDLRQIERVTGYADTRPGPDSNDPETNERVTLNLTLKARSQFKDSKLVDTPVPVSVSDAEAPR
jgi:chemotaxis protein MotB